MSLPSFSHLFVSDTLIPEPGLRGVVLFDHHGAGADFEALHVVQDAASGLKAIVCIHSTALGPAAGGVRRMRYGSEEDALADAARLAHGMSLKNAMAGIPAGGGKAVILDHDGMDRPGAYRALGRFVQSLGGVFRTGPDVGTTLADLDVMREVCDHVNAPSNDAGVATARGVLAGIHGTLAALEDDREFAGRSFVVQGLGEVGFHVAKGLVEAGADVAGCDVSTDACARAESSGVRVIAPDRALTEPCDVLVPCALGGILTEQAVPELAARAVCGSANNQLADPAAGRVLHARGVLWAPDFVVNAGAVIEGVLTFDRGATDEVRADAARRIDAIEGTVRDVFAASARDGLPPGDVAVAMAEARIRDARA